MGHKVCIKCGKEFDPPRCKECTNASRRITKPWRKPARRAASRNAHLRRRFGLSEEQYGAILNAQGGVCAICSTSPTNGMWGKLVVDHDHETTKNRGLLCRKCNLALERLERDPDWGNKAFTYLAKYIEVLVDG